MKFNAISPKSAAPTDRKTTGILKVVLDYHYVRVGDHYYTDLAFDYAFWREFLEIFDQVEPIARVRCAATVSPGWIRADGPGVVFHPVADYRGLWSFLRRSPRVLRDCFRWASLPGVILLRTGNLSSFCSLKLWLSRRPYAMEILGHAGESSARVKNVQFLGLGQLIGWITHRVCRIVAARAACANYVSKSLQRLYPTRSGQEWVFSDVRLPVEAFAPVRPAQSFERRPLRLVTVGRLEPEKAYDVLIRAMSELTRQGMPDLEVMIVGDGSQMDYLRRLAGELGLERRVKLPGRVPPGEALQRLLDESDVFVLPSLTEGMPRALLEAMARGLPAVASKVGGVPELLAEAETVPPGDVGALAQCLARCLGDPQRLAALSRRNVGVAQDYRLDVLEQRKLAFWRCIAATAPYGR